MLSFFISGGWYIMEDRSTFTFKIDATGRGGVFLNGEELKNVSAVDIQTAAHSASIVVITFSAVNIEGEIEIDGNIVLKDYDNGKEVS